MFRVLGSAVFNYSIFKLLDKNMNSNLSRNFVAAFHAINVVINILVYFITENIKFYHDCAYFSSGFFLFDMYYMLKYEKIKTPNLILLYHHVIVIYSLSLQLNYYQDIGLFFGELSNIPNYFVYHSLKTNKLDLVFWKKIQKYVYGPIRITFLGYSVYLNYFYAPDRHVLCLAFPIYLMGIGWTIILKKRESVFQEKSKTS